MYYSNKDYRFLKFEKSDTIGKKYDAIIERIKDGKRVKLPFGALGYQHYKDTTGQGLYNKLDHNDKARRERYRDRHKVYLKDGYYSPGYFSWHYLW